MSTHGVLAKSICIAACTTALATGVPLAPAYGDDRRCVSQREYRAVLEAEWEDWAGWRQARVADHFDASGTRIYSNGRTVGGFRFVDSVWKYRKCSPWGPGGWYVGIWYDNYWAYNLGYDPRRYMRVWDKVPRTPGQLVQRAEAMGDDKY